MGYSDWISGSQRQAVLNLVRQQYIKTAKNRQLEADKHMLEDIDEWGAFFIQQTDRLIDGFDKYQAGNADFLRLECKNRYLIRVGYVKCDLSLCDSYNKEKYDINPEGSIEGPTAYTPKKGCYVATCVYGSYDCPQVWTLRRFRDEMLAKSILGRLFIFVYYSISPIVVKLFGKQAWFNRLFKAPLDRLVGRLKEKGVEDTPYNDK